MVSILLALLLQAPSQAGQSVDLPVSLDRVRQGLARPGRFEVPPPRRMRGRPLFRTRIDQVMPPGNAWDETWVTSPWIRTPAPPAHFEFLSAVTPEEFRSATLYPCCNVTPIITGVVGIVGKGIDAVKQARARREVEQAMKAAGIRR